MVVSGALALASCQQVADEAPAEAPAMPTETVAGPADTPPPTGYPPLQSVPPRPQLSYTVQQQREIVEALVADRENARYTSQVVRYRSGLSSMPPPPAPPEKIVAMPAEPARNTGDAAVAEPGLPDQAGLTEEETLVDFLATLRRQIFSDEPEPPAEAPGPAAQEAETPSTGSGLVAAGTPARIADGQEPVRVAEVAPSEQQLDPPPMPPARSAVAARMASRPQPIDDLLDESVAQAPLPPMRAAFAARRDGPQPTEVVAASAAPVPALRPVATRSARVVLPSARPLVLAPPPIKPVVPILAPSDPKPDGDRSAELPPSQHPETGASRAQAPARS